MNNNLRLIINNVNNRKIEEKHFFEKDELKIILDLYAKMVSEGSWKDYGLSISSKQVLENFDAIKQGKNIEKFFRIEKFTRKC